MCGIFFSVHGICATSHKCTSFNIFENYAKNAFVEENIELRSKYLSDSSSFDFIKHLISNNLLIDSSITLQDVYTSIGPRGPNAFTFRHFNFQPSSGLLSHKLLPSIYDPLIGAAVARVTKESEESKASYEPEQNIQMTFCSSLLHLRGEKDVLNLQPIVRPDKHSKEEVLEGSETCARISSSTTPSSTSSSTATSASSAFIYNGEIFSANDGLGFDPFSSDTAFMFDLLANIIDGAPPETPSKSLGFQLSNSLRQLSGDYAFVYFSAVHKKIFIAKDPFGKRSLLFGLSPNGFTISSSSIKADSRRLIREADAADGEDEAVEFCSSKTLLEDVKLDLKDPAQRVKFLERKYLQDYLSAKEKEWVELPSNTLLIIDITHKAACVWDSFEINSDLFHLPYSYESTTIPLSPAPEKSIEAVTEALIQSVKEHVQNIIEYKEFFSKKESFSTSSPSSKEKIKKMANADIPIENVLFSSTSNTFSEHPHTTSRVSVLFSGGLDSTLLTLCLDSILSPTESIDLLNLSFKADASDRITGLTALSELQSLNPDRRYNLILIDKTLEDLTLEESSLLQTIYPRITHMDFNIALVLSLASRATGYLYDDPLKAPITSAAKVIISGLGADEIFGGYSRYRNAFQRGGYDDLTKEMKFDLQRLWIRNLGRDDRAISNNGREVRFPFLNEKFIKSAKESAEFAYFTDFTMPKGTGDKILLRQVAHRLGLIMTSGFRKKAIQFGTGIAKQSNIRNFGSNRKAKGCFNYTASKPDSKKKK